jgi:hypothetical protein
MSDPDAFALGGRADPEEEVDHAEMAAIEFEPIEDVDRLFAAFGAVQWKKTTDALGIDCRLAAAVLGRTKPQLVEMARELLQADTTDGYFELVDRLMATREWLGSITATVEDASKRLLIAAYASALELEVVGEDEDTGG